MADVDTQFNEQEANAFIKMVTEKNDQVKAVLDEVAELLQTINKISAGPFVDKLVEIGQKFHDQFTKLINEVKAFIGTLEDIKQKMIDKAAELVEGVIEGVGHVINAVVS